MCIKEIGFELMVKIYLIRDGDQQWDNRKTQMDIRVPGTWAISSSVVLCVGK
jgi:hypothetical protein